MLNEGDKINSESEIVLTVEREGKEYTIEFMPEYVDKDIYQMGIYIDPEKPLVSSIADNSAASEGGMQVGDIIISINGVLVNHSNEISPLVEDSNGEVMAIVVERDGSEVELNFAAKTVHTTYYDYGYSLSGMREKCGPLATVGYAFEQVRFWIESVFGSFRLLFKGVATVNDLSGPVGIVSAISDVVEESKSDGALYIFLNLANWCVMISANLGVMNLLPLPALDGGRLTFLFIEAIRRKPIPREKEGMVHFVGIVLLMILMVFVLFNDIRKLF
jgi:regulator of sigma E protease